MLALGYLSTVLAGPLTGEEITEAGMEPDVDEIDLESNKKPEVQVINRGDAEIADRTCRVSGEQCHNFKCCSQKCCSKKCKPRPHSRIATELACA